MDAELVAPTLPATRTCRGLVDGAFPDRISETGCFSAAGVPAEELVRYEVNAPLWSDGLPKERRVALPRGGRIEVDGPTWRFPDGAVLTKAFLAPDSERVIETRMMVRVNGEWRFASYVWAVDMAEAWRTDTGLTTDVEGLPARYAVPSGETCLVCHGGYAPNDPATLPPDVLGFTADQITQVVEYDAGLADQVEVFQAIEWLPDGARSELPLVDPSDRSASIEDRARSYLAANCAHCHQPGGWTPATLGMDLRWRAETSGICDVPVAYSAANPVSTRLTPGDRHASAVYRRLVGDGASAMPPTAAARRDAEGAGVVGAWIDARTSCAP